MLSIPTEETISVEWFNACFARAGLTGTVTGFDAERVGTGADRQVRALFPALF